MFNLFKTHINKIYHSFSQTLTSLLQGQKKLSPEVEHSLKKILIEADTGYTATEKMLKRIREQHDQENIIESLRTVLQEIIVSKPLPDASLYMLVGVNGSGKTTAVAKLAHKLSSAKKRILLVGADTFRAAAQAQLAHWAHILGISFFKGTNTQDPAAVAFGGAQQVKDGIVDTAIIDTAGRLQNKTHLMAELQKIYRVITKLIPAEQICVLLTIDATLGQNSLDQARVFTESIPVNGIILTKLDGSSKGGIICAISQEINVPVMLVSFGESIDDIADFDKDAFIDGIIGK